MPKQQGAIDVDRIIGDIRRRHRGPRRLIEAALIGVGALILLALVQMRSVQVRPPSDVAASSTTHRLPMPAKGARFTAGGACLVRNNHTSLPMANASDQGEGFAKAFFPGISDIATLRGLCTKDVYQRLIAQYAAAGNHDPVQREVALYDAEGAFVMSGGSDLGDGPIPVP